MWYAFKYIAIFYYVYANVILFKNIRNTEKKANKTVNKKKKKKNNNKKRMNRCYDSSYAHRSLLESEVIVKITSQT